MFTDDDKGFMEMLSKSNHCVAASLINLFIILNAAAIAFH